MLSILQHIIQIPVVEKEKDFQKSIAHTNNFFFILTNIGCTKYFSGLRKIKK